MDLFLRKLFKLYAYIKKLEDLMTKSIDIDNQKQDYYLINKDIVFRYLDSQIYQDFKKYLDDTIVKGKYPELNQNMIEYCKDINNSNNNQNTVKDNWVDKISGLNNLINEFIDKRKINEEEIIEENDVTQSFSSPELLKIQQFEFPNNFFILEDDIFNLLSSKDTRKYKIFIGKEGIFIENYFKDEYDNGKLYVYFIKSMKELTLENIRLNKIYIFNDEKQFISEFKNNMKGKEAESYFGSRNFINKGGIFNITDNGKKIGLYINIIRSENYRNYQNEEDENRKYIEKFL